MRALEFAADEAGALGHTLIGTEHVLLGILHEPDGTAARALIKIGVSSEVIRFTLHGQMDVAPAAVDDLRTRAIADLAALGVTLDEDLGRQVADAIVKAGWRPRP